MMNTPYEEPFHRDFYRQVTETARVTTRGINGPIFGRNGCGGANANGDLFRGRGELIYERPPRVFEHPTVDLLRPRSISKPFAPPTISGSHLMSQRERVAGCIHVDRMLCTADLRRANVLPSASLPWPRIGFESPRSPTPYS